MSLDLATIKRRRAIMMVVNVVAAVAALVSIVAYFKLALGWALIPFVVALLVGFAAQIWFIAGLKGPRISQDSSMRETRTDGGA
jgi:CHASE2 domain-containing sensor protein